MATTAPAGVDLSVVRLVKALRKYCPTDMPVKITVKDMVSLAGQLERNGHSHYELNVDAGTNYVIVLPCGTVYAQRDTLIHEWAHAMVWRESKLEHGPRWGLAYAYAYRVGIEKWRPKKKFSLANLT